MVIAERPTIAPDISEEKAVELTELTPSMIFVTPKNLEDRHELRRELTPFAKRLYAIIRLETELRTILNTEEMAGREHQSRAQRVNRDVNCCVEQLNEDIESGDVRLDGSNKRRISRGENLQRLEVQFRMISKERNDAILRQWEGQNGEKLIDQVEVFNIDTHIKAATI